MLSIFQKKDRKLGVAEKKRQYDLPLNEDEGTLFLKILIGLMSFLAIMALAFSFSLDHLAYSWSSGLENNLTIEIPVQTETGTLRPAEQISSLEAKTLTTLENINSIKTFKRLGKEEIKELISPWLGEDLPLSELPLPSLISVEFYSGSTNGITELKGKLAAIDESIKVDTHQDWLSNILSLTGSLQFASLLITFVIALTTMAAVAGAVRSRMAIHKADVELLHLMGASDIYITKQFQRHALILALHGSLSGTLISLIILGLLSLFFTDGAESLMPDINLSLPHIIAIIVLPAIACVISSYVARFTVLRTLGAMP